MPEENQLVEDLTQLKELLDNGIIHETEFAQMKKDIIEKRNIPTSNNPMPTANTTLSSPSTESFIKFFWPYLIIMIIIFYQTKLKLIIK